MIAKIEAVFRQEAEAIQNIPVTEEYEKAIKIIGECVHKKGGKLVASGMGKAGQIALNIATTFSSTGTPAVFLHPSDAQHGDLGVLQASDVLLLISNSGKTREILELVELADRLYEKLPLIVITSKEDSELARMSDACLLTGDPKEVCILGLNAEYFDNYDDCDRRCFGCTDDGTNRIYQRRICQTASWRLSWR